MYRHHGSSVQIPQQDSFRIWITCPSLEIWCIDFRSTQLTHRYRRTALLGCLPTRLWRLSPASLWRILPIHLGTTSSCSVNTSSSSSVDTLSELKHTPSSFGKLSSTRLRRLLPACLKRLPLACLWRVPQCRLKISSSSSPVETLSKSSSRLSKGDFS